MVYLNMGNYKNYTEEELISAVETSRSKRQVLQKIGLSPQGGNYKTVTNAIKRLNINVDHFKGMRWSKGKTFKPKRTIEEYLSNEQTIQSFRLKNRLIKEKILTSVCSSCGLTEWLDDPIPLELDHINGNSLDNSLSNLRLLCPNCHALTPTYRGKNKGKEAKWEKEWGSNPQEGF